MVPQIASTLREARELIRNRKFHEALAQLKSVDCSELTESETGELCVVRARAAVFSGSEDQLPKDIDKAIEVFRDGSTALFAEAKYLRGVWLTVQGEYPEAKQDLLEAHVSYLRCGDKAGSAAALSRLAYSQFMTGDCSAGIRNQEECVRAYAQMNSRKNEVACSQTLFVYYLKAGRLKKSVEGYGRIASQIPQLGDRSRLIFHFNHALALATVGRLPIAKKEIAKGEQYLDAYPRMRGIYYENLGLINILDGKYTAAGKALMAALDVADELESAPALVAQVKRLLGDLYVATEEWAKAEQFTNEALAVAERIGERVEIAACHRIFAQLEQHRGNDSRARDWFTKAIQIFSLLGSNYELAVTRYVAGVSGLYQNGDRQAYLWMARQYFDSEQVKPYLTKIDKTLASTSASPKAKNGNLLLPSPKVIGKSKVMTDIIRMAEQVAPLSMTVFLTGATGTGKDLLAKYIHHHSGLAGEFVSVNAAAIPGPMIESELFGHKKGSFTGSEADRAGLLEQANDGTFYLNEIADATMEFQAKLLEVLETREVRRVGDDKNRPVSFRLIAATNHDLKLRISEGKFRLDLYHRLNEIPIELPPLSDRVEDIPALVAHFLGNASDGYKRNGNREVFDRLAFLLSVLDYDGNIRELKNRVKALRHTSGGDIERMTEHLLSNTLSEHEWLTRILHRTSWNRREAARLLGVCEGTIRNRILKFELSPLS